MRCGAEEVGRGRGERLWQKEDANETRSAAIGMRGHLRAIERELNNNEWCTCALRCTTWCSYGKGGVQVL